MPPIALGAVTRAVRAGCDTMQKIRNRTRDHYKNHEIRKALDALVRSGDIAREGRRYRSQRAIPKSRPQSSSPISTASQRIMPHPVSLPFHTGHSD